MNTDQYTNQYTNCTPIPRRITTWLSTLSTPTSSGDHTFWQRPGRKIETGNILFNTNLEIYIGG